MESKKKLPEIPNENHTQQEEENNLIEIWNDFTKFITSLLACEKTKVETEKTKVEIGQEINKEKITFTHGNVKDEINRLDKDKIRDLLNINIQSNPKPKEGLKLTTLSSHEIWLISNKLLEINPKLKINFSIPDRIKENQDKPNGKALKLSFKHGNVVNTIKQITTNNEECEKIKNSPSIFLFRDGVNLSDFEVKEITKAIVDINPRAKIFIDQEGGKIKRFVDFKDKETKNEYIDKTISAIGISEDKKAGLKNELNKIMKDDKYFPSLASIGELYEKLDGDSAKDFLKAVTYMKLRVLKDSGINTYGLVTDLDRGNPVISGLGRSFSSNPVSYEAFGKAMIDNANVLGMDIYLKHFPGHGAGKIDTHKGVLIYNEDNENYLKENVSLFSDLLDYGKGNVGIMTGHIVIKSSYKNEYDNVLDKAKFVITDDQNMEGYKKIPNGYFKINNGEIDKNNVIQENPNNDEYYYLPTKNYNTGKTISLQGVAEIK